ncbi:hypothetical protein AAMO2058_001057400 [Amorphochlora amoebiformis]|uniref:Uncharacterized protein n=1 Tax=Amorphochlora amoebiformis TaxID=1561963 RepID=A0A7S0H625_9EUKA|mmetsp:Transcript_6866/g.10637  ORF Transcript_6866/g.10637 Transcript_6866/m.10637 type:complete len:180 (+) Transcript_6866:73-612(+)
MSARAPALLTFLCVCSIFVLWTSHVTVVRNIRGTHGKKSVSSATSLVTSPEKGRRKTKKRKKRDEVVESAMIPLGDGEGYEEVFEEIEKAKKKQRTLPTPTPPIPLVANAQETSKSSKKSDEWLDDGLGGRYDKEGFTGRNTLDDDRFRIFKIDELKKQNKPNSGKTPLCPFDCECCFI